MKFKRYKSEWGYEYTIPQLLFNGLLGICVGVCGFWMYVQSVNNDMSRYTEQFQPVAQPTVVAVESLPYMPPPEEIERKELILKQDLPPLPKDIDWEFFQAVKQVETKGDVKAFNQKEQARGPVQIRPTVLQDLKQLGLGDYKSEDCHDTMLSFEMQKKYLDFYIEKMGYQDTLENRAKVWNGGPRGPQKAATQKYWEEVHQVWKSLQ